MCASAAWQPHFRRGQKTAQPVRASAVATFADMLGFDLADEDDAAALRTSTVSFLAHFAVGRVPPHPALLAEPAPSAAAAAADSAQADLSGMVVAPQDIFLQQLAALEEYSVTSEQLFEGVSGELEEVGVAEADGWRARLPRGATEVVRGATELTEAHGTVVRVPDGGALTAYIKVQPHLSRCSSPRAAPRHCAAPPTASLHCSQHCQQHVAASHSSPGRRLHRHDKHRHTLHQSL